MAKAKTKKEPEVKYGTLAATVIVRRDGRRVVLEKGSVLPKWAAGKVTNPKAFVTGEVPPAEDEE